MKIKLRTLLFIYLVTIGAAIAASESERLPLSKGMYRMAGSCTKMNHLSFEETSNCANRFGINATDPALPQFIFSTNGGGAWIFVTSEPAILTEGGNVATYPVSSVLDLTIKAAFNYKGECVLDMKTPDTIITCTLWKDDSRVKVMWEAQYKGTGVWQFSKLN